jgi:hypothetical protein
MRDLIELAGGDDPRPACLMCFEKDVRDCHRGQIASVWESWTGEPIYDLALLTSRRGDFVALVHEVPWQLAKIDNTCPNPESPCKSRVPADAGDSGHEGSQ